jgi:myo-inositol-1(or 4)-monophosphatase
LTEGNDVQLGIVYDPLRDEMFSAFRGEGAFLNDQRVSVSTKATVRESLVGLDLGYVDENGKRLLGFITELWPNVHALRLMGSAALGMAYAACGRLDLYFHLLLYRWELACGQLLVTEAGGVATDWHGTPLGSGESSVIASNEAVHADFLRTILERQTRQ